MTGRIRSREYLLEKARSGKPFVGETQEDLVATMFSLKDLLKESRSTGAPSITTTPQAKRTAWGDIDGVPKEFPPAPHTHAFPVMRDTFKVKASVEDAVPGFLGEKVQDNTHVKWKVNAEQRLEAEVQEGAGDSYKVKNAADDTPGFHEAKHGDATDLQFTAKGEVLDSIVYQLTGLGARLTPVATDFEWAGWTKFGYLYGGRGISPGYAWIGDPGAQVHARVWAANDAGGNIYWTRDLWKTTTLDTSFEQINAADQYVYRPPCLKYAVVDGVPAWIITSSFSSKWWYAPDVPSSYNTNGTLTSAAWRVFDRVSASQRQIADIAGTADGGFLLVGNHGWISKTSNWEDCRDVYSGSEVIGGIDCDKSTGTALAVERDTGVVLLSNDDGETWEKPQVFVLNSDDVFVEATAVLPSGCVAYGNGVWLITGSQGGGYAFSEDGIHWILGDNPLGSFYGLASDGVRFFATNPDKTSDPKQQVIVRLLVSEIPCHRHLICEKGATVDNGMWFPDMPSVPCLGTDEQGRVVAKTDPSGSRAKQIVIGNGIDSLLTIEHGLGTQKILDVTFQTISDNAAFAAGWAVLSASTIQVSIKPPPAALSVLASIQYLTP